MEQIESFERFLAEEVLLGAAARRRLNRTTNAVTEFLSRKLNGYQYHERQGSYAHGTIIRPGSNGEYDADVLVFMEYVRGKPARDYVSELHDCLRQNSDMADKLDQRTRCVSVKFSGGFRLDLVPCIQRARGRVICDSENDQFEDTDGAGYREWFNQKANITNGHLKGAVSLLKYLRDHKGNFEVPSVLLTTLAGHSVHTNERGKRFRNSPETLRTVSNRINSFFQAVPRRPKVRNPSLRSERFIRHWDQRDYRNLRDKFSVYNAHIIDAYEEPDSEESLRKWRSLFGDKFL